MVKDLHSLATEELGKLFPIIICDHDPGWKSLYNSEERLIIEAVGRKNIYSIEHIGSTAVPGLVAKPTIDILIEIPDASDEDRLINDLKRIGYHFIRKPENPPPHMMFAKGYSKDGITGQTYHVHVRYPGE